MNFYKCKECGDVIIKLNDAEVCGEKMEKLVAGSVDAAREKHVPALTRNGNELHVVVGDVEHPMVEDHWIQAIVAVQGNKTQIVKLNPGEKPVADFVLEDGPVVVYEYCNKHGLWKAEA